MMSLVGGLLGSAIVAKLKLKLTGLVKMMLLCCGAMLLAAVIGMFLVCPKVVIGGDRDAESGKWVSVKNLNRCKINNN